MLCLQVTELIYIGGVIILIFPPVRVVIEDLFNQLNDFEPVSLPLLGGLQKIL